MRKYLLFRLHGPLASWGDIAVGEVRPSFVHPGKSTILGLVAAAMGVTRSRENEHTLLDRALRYAVRVDAPGTLLRDYHTIQVPKAKKGQSYASRKEELETDKLNLVTILSTREYRCDTVYTVCLWTDDSKADITLSDIARSLRQPRFTPYLGRKSCPPSLPFQPQIVEAGTVRDAFLKARFVDNDFLRKILESGPRQVFWEGNLDEGFERQQSITRRDAILSRKRWQFLDRTEHYAMYDFLGEE